MVRTTLWAVSAALLAVAAVGQVNDSLVVHLDARDAAAGTETWINRAGAGDFKRVGSPRVETVGGAKAVTFDGKQDAYVGPAAPPVLLGDNARTVELWVFNPYVDSPEETMVAWGRRGGPFGTGFSFNYGSSPEFGAATHWGMDMGWSGVPAPGRWHHLVYTYDGRTARIYDNTAEKGARRVFLNTAGDNSINLAVQNSTSGQLQFTNETDGAALAGSLAISVVRIYSRTLTPEEIKVGFEQDAKRFDAQVGETFEQLRAKALSLDSGSLSLALMPGTQVVAALSPKGSTFDFTPGDRLKQRISEGFYHLGDVTLRARTASGAWKTYSTARGHSLVRPLEMDGAAAAADLTPAIGADSPVEVERRWLDEGGRLVLRYVVRNKSDQPVELGAFGAAMVFNNDFTRRRLDDTHEKCSFADPYVGGGAGYLQVTRVNGQAPALLVIPEPGTGFEAYRPLEDDPTRRGVTFEGFYEWMVHSKAWAENEWKNAAQFNQPTSRTLAAGETVTYGFVLVTAREIREIDAALSANGMPVAVGIPGYVLPTDQKGRLFIKSADPISSIVAEPAGAMAFSRDAKPTPGKWQGFTVSGRQTGRCRVVVTYADGRRQFIHYNVIPPQAAQVKRLAQFHQSKQWFADKKDPFGRTYSYLPWDRQADKLIVQEPRVYISGLSDEPGAGANLLMAMKNVMMPDPAQVAQLEKYVDNALWGRLQYKDNYGVRASLFYWDPTGLPGYYTIGWGCWDEPRSKTTWRAYNYPHQAAVYWCLYRLARDHPGLVKAHKWDWYLRQACRTGLALREHCGQDDFLSLSQYGLMDGTVFVEILADLRREGWKAEADEFEAFMKSRADIWKSLRYPFGSEMPWDSTGQEEVYAWCKHFRYDDKARVTLDAVTAYMPCIPNWAYNGNGRRYFDISVYGKRGQIARECHHYGASLNAIPMLTAFRESPTDFHLLRAGYAGANGVLSNINEQGHGSMAFLADPAIMDYEPYSGDYGSAFFGHAYSAGAYVVKHPEFGWLGFGCDVSEAKGVVRIVPKDAFCRRAYLASLGLWLTLDAGTFESLEIDPASGKVRVSLSPAAPFTRTALLRVEHPGAAGRRWKPTTSLPIVRGAYSVKLGAKPTVVVLQRAPQTKWTLDKPGVKA